MAAPQTIRFLEDKAESKRYRPWISQHSRDEKERMERSQLPVALPVHESGSPRTIPPDMLNQGIPQPNERCQCTLCGCNTYNII